MRIKPIFAWYDLWVGAYFDRKKMCLYVLPVPCLGFMINLSRKGHERSGGDNGKMVEGD